MKILVLGTGAREHAIITALLAEEAGHDIVAAPGNAGIAQEVRVDATLDPLDGVAVTEYAIENGIELVVIGPEAPLVAGVADPLRTRGIPVFGPGKAAAQLEGSKAFAKRIMDAAGVPTGRAVRAETLAEAEEALDDFGAPYVVKADGLAAGKGVLVTEDRDAAVEHATHWLRHGGVLVEEFLDGQEVSLFLFSDGHDVLPLSPAQDYKRILDGDQGPTHHRILQRCTAKLVGIFDAGDLDEHVECPLVTMTNRPNQQLARQHRVALGVARWCQWQ